MKNRRHYRIMNAFKLSAVLLAALMMISVATPAFALPEAGDTAADEPIMVSLGDSYSSGEGVEPFYCAGRADKYTQPDWLAHRSMLSWPGRLQLTDSTGKRLTMSKCKASYSGDTKSYDSYNKNNWYFVASSGAVTGSLNGTQGKTFENNPKKESALEQTTVILDNQLKVFDSIAPGTTDYVTMTMGGNDAHFADVFIYAALNCSFININGMDDYLNTIWNEFYNGPNSIQKRLIRAYTDIHRAAGDQADILIAGYPKILPKTGFLIFSITEAASINNAITKLNGEMKSIIENLCTDTFKIHFVSVEEAFEGHEIYTGILHEYIHGIKLVRAEDLSHSQIISSYSLHPNLQGIKAYAACMQECIDQIELEKQNANIATRDEVIPADSADTAAPEPTEAVEVLCESGEVCAQAGEEIQIPVCISGNVPLSTCTVRAAYDSEALEIHGICPAESNDDSWSDTLGETENAFDITWRTAPDTPANGTLFYLNATVLTSQETAIHLSAQAAGVSDADTPLATRCEDVVINNAQTRCTLTADFTDLPVLQGAEILYTDSRTPTAPRAVALDAQNRFTLVLGADAAPVELRLYKPGYTCLHIVLESLVAGENIDLTDTLKQAAAQEPLLALGDVNRDGCVSDDDVAQLSAPEYYGAVATECLPDLNADDLISLEDVALVLCSENYGAKDLTLTYSGAQSES